MRLKVVIVDLEIPAHVRVWSLRIGVPLLLLMAAGAVAFAGGDAGPQLVTWSSGETLRAADLNANFQVIQGELSALPKPLVAVVAVEVPQNATPAADFCFNALSDLATGMLTTNADQYGIFDCPYACTQACSNGGYVGGWYSGAVTTTPATIECDCIK
jgi:hypothetical protein